MKSLYAKQIDTLAFERFRDEVGELSISKLANGDLKSISTTLKHRVLVPIGGNQSLLKANNIQKDGISDFDGNKLPANEIRVIKQLRIGYDYDPAADKESTLKYNKALEAAFRNAQLEIKQGNKIVVNEPLSDLIVEGVSTNADDRYITLDLPYVLVGVKTNEINITFADDATAKMVSSAVQKEYLEIIQKGTLYTDRA